VDDVRSTKRRLRATAGWLVPLMAGLLQFAAPGQTPDPRKALVTDNAIIYYHRSDKRNALKVAEAIRINLPRIEQTLGVHMAHLPRIYLCASLREFDKLAPDNPGPWVLGEAFPERNVIVIKSMPAAKTLQGLTLHELTHLMFAQALGDALGAAPLWLNEGIAVFLSGEWGPGHEATLLDAAGQGRLISLSDIADSFPRDPMHSGLAYAESGAFVQFLAGAPASGRLARLLSALREEKDMPAAVLKVFGEPLDVLEQDWRVALGRSHRWQPLWGQIGNMIFGLMAVLTIVAFVARRIHRARRIREDEDELFPWE